MKPTPIIESKRISELLQVRFWKYLLVRLTGGNYRVFYDFDYPNAVEVTRDKLLPGDTATYWQVKRYEHL